MTNSHKVVKLINQYFTRILFNIGMLLAHDFLTQNFSNTNEYFNHRLSSISISNAESKEKRGENSYFLLLGQRVRLDIFGQ